MQRLLEGKAALIFGARDLFGAITLIETVHRAIKVLVSDLGVRHRRQCCEPTGSQMTACKTGTLDVAIRAHADAVAAARSQRALRPRVRNRSNLPQVRHFDDAVILLQDPTFRERLLIWLGLGTARRLYA